MKLGAFSVSLSVKDIGKSLAFYEKLGFSILGGNRDENWLIIRNESCVIGLFQGMFQGNILTFNPGWSGEGEELCEFTDIREIHRQLQTSGIEAGSLTQEADHGPASFMLNDPDGNAILMDQHF